mmetsp:Transcript_39423/g.72207  ORF Transcript_39423/g.72207 Transcript_39423/m.72207 type:complete len:217 (-) Transcript_39423:225-875(-)
MASANFGELVLLLGDHHMPSRSISIPEPFQRMLLPNKMQHVICTGNIGNVEEYERLRELVGGSSTSVHCVAGEYDVINNGSIAANAEQGGGGNNATASSSSPPSFPETKVIQLGQFRVGIIGGHQVVPWGDLSALAMVRRRLNADVLVCGAKRQEGVVEYDGGYYIFPVSFDILDILFIVRVFYCIWSQSRIGMEDEDEDYLGWCCYKTVSLMIHS